MSMLPGQEPLRPPHPARHAFSVLGLLVWVVFIIGAFFAAAYYVSTVLTSGNMAAVITSALVDLANEDREAENLGVLTVNPVLVEAAQAKADDMAAKGYFAHVTPEGYQPWHWFKEAGYEYSSAGENLAVNFTDSKNVEEAWMNSPTHRANILNGKFTEIGIATAVGEYKGRTTTFVVQMFGTPRPVTASANAPEQAVTPADPEEIAVAVREEEDAEILGSEIATTVPAEAVAPAAIPPVSYATPGDRALASPEGFLRSLYLLSGLVVLIALGLTTRLELRRHHVRHVAAAAFLLMLMAGTLALADRIIFTEPILAEAAQSGA